MANTSKKSTFTAKQMETINAMIAAAVNEAVVTTVATMQAAKPAAAVQGQRTAAIAREQSWTRSITNHVVKPLNNGIAFVGTKIGNGLEIAEINAAPMVVASTGYVAAKSVNGLSWAERKLNALTVKCAAKSAQMAFVPAVK